MEKGSSSDTNDQLRLLNNNSCAAMQYYLMLHQEITALAYKHTRELETAKDIASECLIEWWQQASNNGKVQIDKNSFTKTISILYDSIRNQIKKRRLSEHEFVQEQLVFMPAYQTFRIAEKGMVLQLSRLLQPLEQTVIRLILIEEFDLTEISAILKKPVPTIKILRDRATIMLRKNVVKAGIGG